MYLCSANPKRTAEVEDRGSNKVCEMASSLEWVIPSSGILLENVFYHNPNSVIIINQPKHQVNYESSTFERSKL